MLFSPREKDKKFTFQSSALLVKSFPGFIETVRTFGNIKDGIRRRSSNRQSMLCYLRKSLYRRLESLIFYKI